MSVRSIGAFLLCLVMTLAATHSANASDDTPSRQSLVALNNICVVVALTGAQAQAGFNESTFQTDVELKLRSAGLTVPNESSKCDAWLFVCIGALHKRPNERVAFRTDLLLQQNVLLARDPSSQVMGTTWFVGGVGTGDLEYIRKLIRDNTDQFFNAWLSPIRPS
ncbi:MAG TPA: hypothetical protein VKM54_09660 [Myxococcota bacterium]|nr:hypothetical protein [Myxococcota bacterium]